MIKIKKFYDLHTKSVIDYLILTTIPEFSFLCNKRVPALVRGNLEIMTTISTVLLADWI